MIDEKGAIVPTTQDDPLADPEVVMAGLRCEVARLRELVAEAGRTIEQKGLSCKQAWEDGFQEGLQITHERDREKRREGWREACEVLANWLHDEALAQAFGHITTLEEAANYAKKLRDQGPPE